MSVQRGDTCETFQNVIAFAKSVRSYIPQRSPTELARTKPQHSYHNARTIPLRQMAGPVVCPCVCVARRRRRFSCRLTSILNGRKVCVERSRETRLRWEQEREKKQKKKRSINQARGAFGKREAQFSRLFWADTVRDSGSRFPGRRVATFRSCPVKKWVFSCVSALCSVCVTLYATKVTQNFSSPLCCCCVLKFRKTHLLLLFAVRNIFRLIRTRPRRRLRADLYR